MPLPRLPTAVRKSWRIIRILLIAYLLILILMMFFEESMLYFPEKYPGGYWTPAGLQFEDAWFTAADGTKLHGWYVPHEKPRAYALFSHGNAGNISGRDDVLRELHRLGVAVLAYDYRGYGRSEGAPNEQGVLADGRAARTWLAKHAGVQESAIIMMGESLGGAVSAILAGEAPARGLVIENSFSSAPEVGAFHYPWLPIKQFMRTQLDAAKAIKNYHGPYLQVHGTADTIVPFSIGKQLFAAANEPKQFVEISAGDHNDPRTPQFYAALDKLIDSLPPAAESR
jgi:uncharacterized protein